MGYFCSFVLALLLFALPCFADTTIVEVGQGLTEDAAIQDSLRKAVESATGVFLYSESEVDKFILVKDKIITASNGYVKDFKVLEKSNLDGKVIIKVRVNVDDTNIRSVVKREAKILALDDVLSDSASVRLQLERNKRIAKILDAIKKKNINSLYTADYLGYEIETPGISNATVILRFRIGLNSFMWNTYYNALRQASADNAASAAYVNYSPVPGTSPQILEAEKILLHDDFSRHILRPRLARLVFTFSGTEHETQGLILYDRLICKAEHKNIKYYSPHANELVTEYGFDYIRDEGFEYRIALQISDTDKLKSLRLVPVKLIEEQDVVEQFLDRLTNFFTD